MSRRFEGFVSNPDVARATIAPACYDYGFEAYYQEAQANKTLHPHQEAIFADTQKFLASEQHYKGYVESPTGTGKTVIFVELSKAIIAAGEAAGRSPRILVVEPSIELVNQTLGRTGPKGYGEFAPGLKLSSYFSDSTSQDDYNLHSADVVVTTYDSLQLMARREATRPSTREEQQEGLIEALKALRSGHGMSLDNLDAQLRDLDTRTTGLDKISTGRSLLDDFDIIILDEAHHILDNKNGELIDELDERVKVIGFTATADADEKRRLINHLPYRIHKLSYNDASSMGLLAPVLSIGIKTGVKVEGSDLFNNQDGDFNDQRLSFLTTSTPRNQIIVNVAKVLTKHGLGTLIPTISGGDAFHARILAKDLNRADVAAAAVYSGIPPEQRKRIYEAFEAGETDALTNIRILGEGWDSSRPKAIIEAQPTRSLINKRQRIGRVLRPNGLAVVVDLLDEFDAMNPPLHMADLIEGNDLKTGDIYGLYDDNEREFANTLLQAIGSVAVLSDVVPAAYSRFFDTISQYPMIKYGTIRSSKGGHFATAERINKRYGGLNDALVKRAFEVSDAEPKVIMAAQGLNLRVLYEAASATKILDSLPVCEQNKQFIEGDNRWLSSEGFRLGFAKEFPGLTVDIVEDRLTELADKLIWRPLKSPRRRKSDVGSNLLQFDIYKAYKGDQATIAMLRKQLQDYFFIQELLNN